MRRLLLLFAVCSISFLVKGQEFEAPSVPTPNAASFMQFVSMPEGTYTGVPHIEVPLITLNDGKASIPVSLRYHGGGIRVSDEASWVGLGWNLDVGGVITRQVKGLHDGNYQDADAVDPSFCHYPNYSLLQNVGYDSRLGDYYGLANNCYDEIANSEGVSYSHAVANGSYEPDIFSFSFLGRSGSFVYDEYQEKIVVLNSSEPLKIELLRGEYGSNETYKIKTQDGTIFEFDLKEIKYPYNDYSRIVSESYYLTRIIYSDGTFGKFDYDVLSEKASSNFSINKSVTTSIGNVDNPDLDTKVNLSVDHYNPVYVKNITTNKFRLDFSDRSAREDIFREDRLDSFTLHDLVSGKSRTFNFQYSYSVSTDDCDGFTAGFLTEAFLGFTESGECRKRLILDKVWETGLEPYEFEYNTTQLPNKTSFNSDHWGYYNGQNVDKNYPFPSFGNFNDTEIPFSDAGYDATIYFNSTKAFVDLPLSGLKTKGSANKGSNSNFTDAQILEKVIYPTKGYTRYNWEPNTFVNRSIPNTSYQSSEEIGNYYFRDTNGGDGPDVTRADFAPGGTKAIVRVEFSVGQVSCTSGGDYDDARKVHIDKLYDGYAGIRTNPYGLEVVEEFRLDPSLLYNGYDNFPNNVVIEKVIEIDPTDPDYFAYIVFPSLTSLEQTLNCGNAWNYGFGIDVSVRVVKEFGGFEATVANPSEGSGLRVQEVANYASNGTKLLKSRYSYEGGKLALPINYFSLSLSADAVLSGGVTTANKSASWTLHSRNSSSFVVGGQSDIGYDKVTVVSGINEANGRTEMEFKNYNPLWSPQNQLFPTVPRYENGQLLKTTIFDNDGDKVQERTINYTDLGVSGFHGTLATIISERNEQGNTSTGFHVQYHYSLKYHYWKQSGISTKYFDENNNSKADNVLFEYNDLGQLTKTTNYGSVLSEGNTSTITRYPYELKGTSTIIQQMYDDHYLLPIEIEKFDSDERVYKLELDYEKQSIYIDNAFFNGYYPYEQTVYPTGNTSYSQVTEIEHESGLPSQVKGPDGIYIAILWSDDNQILAIAQNATIGQLSTAYDNNCNGDWACVRSSLPQARITSYQYEPLNGPVTIEDPNGFKTKYNYDQFSRLIDIRDHNNLLLKSFNYHYKGQ
ncbi:MAG: hypothetical protein NXI20_07305 [bacterium]|nr:hypothetical protein [bacterium]